MRLFVPFFDKVTYWRFWPLCMIVLWSSLLQGQGVVVGGTGATPHSSAILDIRGVNKGMLIPRLTTAQRNGIIQPASALLIYNVDLKRMQVNTGSENTPVWQDIVSLEEGDSLQVAWRAMGNEANDDSAFLGNKDARPLIIKTNNAVRIFIDSSVNRIGLFTREPRAAMDINATDAMVVPVGTTAQRPQSPVVGMIRYNKSTGKLEGFTTGGWVALH